MRLHALLTVGLGCALLFAPLGCGDDGDDGGTTPVTQGTVRFLHLANGISSALDVYRRADLLSSPTTATPLATDLTFGQLSPAVSVNSGSSTFVAYFANAQPTGTPVFEAIAQTVTANQTSITTFYTNDDGQTDTRTFVDQREPPEPGEGRFRVVHLAANFDTSVVLFDASDNRNPQALTGNISFGNLASSDLDLPVGPVVLGIGRTNQVQRVFSFNVVQGSYFAFLVSDGAVDSLYLLDQAGNLLTPIDATNFVPPGQGQVNVVHLADGADALDIYFGQTESPAVGPLPENTAAVRQTLVEGTYNVLVVPASGDPAVDAIATLENFQLDPNETVTLVVYDDPTGEVVIEALPPENVSPPMPGEVRYRIVHLGPELGTIHVLNATDPTNPAVIDPSFDGLDFGDVSSYVVRPAVNRIVLGLDADDDPRDDLEVTFDIPNYPALSVLNIFLDTNTGASGTTFEAVAVSVAGSGAASSVFAGVTIPDPSFVRPIHLVSAFGSGIDQTVDFYVSGNPLDTRTFLSS
ncbi:MAG: DUF4397 domain-containing protein, partial [Myxococcales bacterium]|nr:DUF4397 domain-containing protein [Myxococcales bacterium]